MKIPRLVFCEVEQYGWGRNIASKAAKMSETAFEIQSASIARRVGEDVLYLEHQSLEDLRRNADLYWRYTLNQSWSRAI